MTNAVTFHRIADQACAITKRKTTEALVIELGKPVHEILCAELQRAFEADAEFQRRTQESF